MRSLFRTSQASSSYAVQACRKHAFASTATSARKDTGSSKEPFSIRRIKVEHNAPVKAKLRGLDNLEGAPRAEKVTRRTYNIFRTLALAKCDQLMKESGTWDRKQHEYKAFGVETAVDFDRESKLFRVAIDKACDAAAYKNAISRAENPLFWSIRHAFVQGDVGGLVKELKFAFQNFLMRSHFSKNISATHRKIADFRFPHEWFPATRAMQRTVHLHVGPTNSGKTYRALQALENAKSGIYAGPLRMLAHEVYTRFVAKGKPCALVTGEEQRIPEDEDMYFRSCTVEMTPLNLRVDVAIIDEIQMIGDSERGWAWTQAFLGVQAKELHLCGEERSVELIQSLCDTTGDKCTVHRYERLSPLEPMDKVLGGLKNLEKGDAIVSFSRVGIHLLKKQVEKASNRRCAIVYGSLPPETRTQQAALFNDPDNDYDFIVASDAIGMGLNLDIKRVIFEATSKRDQSSFRPITTSEIKQIGGRAGRFRTASSAIKAGSEEDSAGTGEPPAPQQRQPGLVTAMDRDDLAAVHRAFHSEPEPIKTAGIQPPPSVVERFSSYFPPNTPFGFILARLRDIVRLSPRFHLCSPKEMHDLADLIQPYAMSVYDRCVFLNAPVFLRDMNGAVVVQAFAKCVSNMDGGHLLDIPEIDLELLDVDGERYMFGPEEYLRRLEALHKGITLYLWLSYRYSGVFQSQHLAFHVKTLVEEKIDSHLGRLSVSEEARQAKLAAIRSKVKKREDKKKVLLDDVGADDIADEDFGGPPYNDPNEVEQITRLGSDRKEAGSIV
ncbi:P-loop containing nucleoside triphosphate hydrolase protein [Pseudomassariella vexata]|uniref:RNA helicase n=1 Tax=Pseudomassariella vexata TaxID=1141098 RepID=A0A1Y2E1E7_9PEZI|nr:P-loop containing nucleoside triphosphate hydrolase protein [Pseudomassariella vexata]ORY65297.1 P-loop containing nucleoside triphosphate hydrolase protein [Pseudomassariella vexata]